MLDIGTSPWMTQRLPSSKKMSQKYLCRNNVSPSCRLSTPRRRIRTRRSGCECYQDYCYERIRRENYEPGPSIEEAARSQFILGYVLDISTRHCEIAAHCDSEGQTLSKVSIGRDHREDRQEEKISAEGRSCWFSSFEVLSPLCSSPMCNHLMSFWVFNSADTYRDCQKSFFQALFDWPCTLDKIILPD